ncbi:MAG: hypothetical protein JXX29_06370 [Deltaproteobacteria bacterium]|nr:hypothetical protein [Deltaproteobacteria bacterium]MBN2671276.1 hypothetical protein [Deltaproteobacteria bacterium]
MNKWLLMTIWLCTWPLSVHAQDASSDDDDGNAAVVDGESTGDVDDGASAEAKSELQLRAEIARAEAEKAKAEAQKAEADAQRMQAEAQKAQAEASAQREQPANASESPGTQENSEENQPGEENEDEADRPNHRGFYFRFTPGLGISKVWGRGTLDPVPGLERIDDPDHRSVVGSLALDLGGGIVKNLALHVGTFFEKPFLRDAEHEQMAFNLFGLSAGLSWYFTEHDLFLTGQLRLVKMLVKFPTVICTEYFADTFDWYSGPGMSFTFGKEWYEDVEDDGAIGLGVQGNFYRMHGGVDDHFKFNYLSLLLVLTFTHF